MFHFIRKMLRQTASAARTEGRGAYRRVVRKPNIQTETHTYSKLPVRDMS
jgi:hypothetical protein